MVLSTVVPTSFTGVDSLDKTRFRFITGHLRLSLRGTDTGGKSDVLQFVLIAQHTTGIVVLSTVVPTYFMAVDSLDKMRFRFITGHLKYCCQKQKHGGRGGVLPFCLIAQH